MKIESFFSFFLTSKTFDSFIEVSRKQTLRISASISGTESIGFYYFDRMEDVINTR
jgi:hypothetical protein